MAGEAFLHRFLPGSSPVTLLLLHGTGGNEDDLLPLGSAVAPEAHLLSPRGQVLEQGMSRFFRRDASGVFDEADIVRRARDLTTFIADAAARYGLDPAHVVALGYSNGANMAAALMLLHPGVLAGAALLRAVRPLVPPAPPDLTGRPVFVGAAHRDPYAPPDRVEALVAALSAAGARVDLRWHAGGHELGAGEPALLRDWWTREIVPGASALR
jgi:predicted esterase